MEFILQLLWSYGQYLYNLFIIWHHIVMAAVYWVVETALSVGNHLYLAGNTKYARDGLQVAMNEYWT